MATKRSTTAKGSAKGATKGAAKTASKGAAKGGASASSSSGRRSAAKSAPARPATRRSPGSSSAGPSGTSRRTRVSIPTEPSPVEEIVIPNLSPSELYRREKQRRSETPKTESDPIAEARREYLALLAAEAEKGKGGRPKGSGKKKEEPVEEE